MGQLTYSAGFGVGLKWDDAGEFTLDHLWQVREGLDVA